MELLLLERETLGRLCCYCCCNGGFNMANTMCVAGVDADWERLRNGDNGGLVRRIKIWTGNGGYGILLEDLQAASEKGLRPNLGPQQGQIPYSLSSARTCLCNRYRQQYCCLYQKHALHPYLFTFICIVILLLRNKEDRILSFILGLRFNQLGRLWKEE